MNDRVMSGMTDQTRGGSNRSLLRCRAIRWLLSVLLAVGLFEAWSRWPSESTVARARRIRVGQTKAEVALIMGVPRMTYQMGITDREFYGPKTRMQLEIQAFLSTCLSSSLFEVEQFPVGIEYGMDGRVETIRIVPGIK
jgi:hypothetical protein